MVTVRLNISQSDLDRLLSTGVLVWNDVENCYEVGEEHDERTDQAGCPV